MNDEAMNITNIFLGSFIVDFLIAMNFGWAGIFAKLGFNVVVGLVQNIYPHNKFTAGVNKIYESIGKNVKFVVGKPLDFAIEAVEHGVSTIVDAVKNAGSAAVDTFKSAGDFISAKLFGKKEVAADVDLAAALAAALATGAARANEVVSLDPAAKAEAKVAAGSFVERHLVRQAAAKSEGPSIN